ncbi:MAG: nitric oxide reductase activation protein NorD [Rubrivivax sp.]|nr:nitric oxide reductase activation protein NorD [Rubrivivax sp.]
MTAMGQQDDVRVSGRLRTLRETDGQAYEGLLAALPEVGEGLVGGERLAELLDLLNQTAIEAPACAEALVARLATLPSAVDLPALRKWAVRGLQLHATNPAEALRHFEREDPLDFVRSDTDDDEQWAHRQGQLMHYLAGFGHPEIGVEVHRKTTGRRLARRVTLEDGLLLLPRPFGPADPRSRGDLHRAAAAHSLAHLMFSPLHRPVANRPPMLLALISLMEDTRVERLMAQRYPGLRALWHRFHLANRESAGFEFNGLAARLARALHDPDYVDSNAWVNKGRLLFEEVAAQGLGNVAAFDHVGRVLTRQLLRLGLPFQAETYRLEPPYRDDNTVLWNADEPRPEDEQQAVVRDDFELLEDEPKDAPRSDLRQVEVDMRRRTAYPEWDFKLEELRDGWVTVFDETEAGDLPVGRRGVLPPTLRKTPRPPGLDRVPDRSIRLARLHEGDELDLSAAVDSRILLRGRVAPDPRIFRRHGRRRRSAAVVLLMDLSASTQHFVPGSFISVLDLEKRAAALVAESFDASRDRIAVHGFRSNGRREVSYLHIKDFDEPFGSVQRQRLERQQGRLSTRMGAGLRHASAALAAEHVDQRVILLLTDGEPSDVDVLEEDYLVEDARQAVATAASRGIRTLCLTLDRDADHYVRRIFGERHYLIVDRADAFTTRLAQTLVRTVAH